jgi:hypothetical protein
MISEKDALYRLEMARRYLTAAEKMFAYFFRSGSGH